MKKILTALIAFAVTKFVPTKTVDSAVSFATQALSALAAAEAAHKVKASATLEKAATLTAKAEDLVAKSDALNAEAARAAAIRTNLAGVFAPIVG